MGTALMTGMLPLLREKFHRLEDLGVVVILGLMAVLPVMEVIARELFATSITGSIVTVQHLTLWIGFTGAMLASREGRLLTLAGDTAWLRERWGKWSHLIADVASVGITLTLMVASYQLVASERDFPRPIVGPLPTCRARGEEVLIETVLYHASRGDRPRGLRRSSAPGSPPHARSFSFSGS